MDDQPANSALRARPEGGGAPERGPVVFAISGDVMGRGDDELGRVLLRNHLHALSEVTPQPDVIIFFNSGVLLAVEDSPALDDLRTLGAQGAKILLCGTCLGHFGLKEKVAVGEISNMYTITETMLRAGRVINI